MPQPLFIQKTIAIIWDFDKTLTPDYMQSPLFKHFGVDSDTFWDEVNALPDYHKERGLKLISKDTLYLNHILAYVRDGKFAGLSNKLLHKLGSEIDFYPGLPEFFKILKGLVEGNPDYKKHEIEVEHYIVSTGLRQMILGSKIAEHVDDVWGCEFVEGEPKPGYLKEAQQVLVEGEKAISQIGYVIDNTTKTRAVFEINKGTNKIPTIHVNATIPDENRRIPFQNMIYIADGPSDIPVFSLVNRFEGKTYAVYKGGASEEFVQVNNLQKQGRVHSFGEANYAEGSHTYMWILNAVEEIARRIVRDRERALDDTVDPPPEHIT